MTESRDHPADARMRTTDPTSRVGEPENEIPYAPDRKELNVDIHELLAKAEELNAKDFWAKDWDLEFNEFIEDVAQFENIQGHADELTPLYKELYEKLRTLDKARTNGIQTVMQWVNSLAEDITAYARELTGGTLTGTGFQMRYPKHWRTFSISACLDAESADWDEPEFEFTSFEPPIIQSQRDGDLISSAAELLAWFKKTE